jgi:hypothetical protein
MNLSSVLKASKGIPVDDFFALMWGQKIALRYETAEISGALPLTFRADGSALVDYRIWGNVGGVGDVTVNYLDYRKIDYTHIWDTYGQAAPTVGNNMYASHMIAVVAGKTYIRTYNLSPIGNVFFTYDAKKKFISREVAGFGVPFTITDGVAYIAYNIEVSNNYKASAYMLTEGSTAPASFVPFGYEVDIGVKSGNLFDKTVAVYQKYLTDNGSVTTSTVWGITNYINVAPNTAYIIKNAAGENPCYCIYDKDKNLILGEKYNNRQDITFVTGSNAAYIRMSLVYDSGDGRYNLDKLELRRNTTTPIYIGNEPLDKDEYADYQSQKVYRMIDGTLTPTDPPVALPALPTCEGETIIDYAGESVAPEKVVLEYKKGGN